LEGAAKGQAFGGAGVGEVLILRLINSVTPRLTAA
jgi:F0F1-type ATP synthase beta subunit